MAVPVGRERLVGNSRGASSSSISTAMICCYRSSLSCRLAGYVYIRNVALRMGGQNLGDVRESTSRQCSRQCCSRVGGDHQPHFIVVWCWTGLAHGAV